MLRRVGDWVGDRVGNSIRGLGLALTLVAASGCGFQPLYAKPDGGDGVAAELAQVRILPIEDRTGQQLRNYLLDRLNPDGAPVRPRYTLVVTLTKSRADTGIERDETATRAILTLTANFQLREAATGDALFAGIARSVNSFNIVASDFATLNAEIDATNRAAREISEQIRLRLALFLNRRLEG